MYEYIKGELTEIAPTYAVVEAAGVGYHIQISLQTYSAIENESHTKLLVHYIVREDAQLLYGFASKIERELFRLLLGVSGVGGNTARMILSTYSPSELKSIIATENAVLLKNVKGLGLKTAQKIIVDISGKVSSLIEGAEENPVAAVDTTAANEALEALVMLGFTKAASQKAIKAITAESKNLGVEEIIRLALKQL